MTDAALPGPSVDLDFACDEVVADHYAAAPTVLLRMRARDASGLRVHALALRCQFLSHVLPGFTGECAFELTLPLSYDVDVAAHKYLAALEDGDVPLLLLFSGQVFTGTAGAIAVQPVPWHKETAVRLPVAVWREAVDVHFPGQAWLRVRRETFDRLSVYRGRHGMTSMDEALDRLLGEAER